MKRKNQYFDKFTPDVLHSTQYFENDFNKTQINIIYCEENYFCRLQLIVIGYNFKEIIFSNILIFH